MLAAAQRLDELIAEAAGPAPIDAALAGRIAAGLTGRREGAPFRPTGRLLALASAAMAVLFVVGFAAGLTIDTGIGDDPAAQLLFGGTIDAGDFL
jgi:hypothetical protein